MSFPPERLSILAPIRTVKKIRGRHARGSQSMDPQTSLRLAPNQKEAIHEAAKVLELTPSEFMRWVLYASANEVLRLHREATQKGS